MTNLRRIFIRNWKIRARTGVRPHEKTKKQLLRLNVSLFQEEAAARGLDDVICYSAHKSRMEKEILARHYPLLENMAEALVACAFEDHKVKQVIVRIEKLRILPGAESCGIRIEREKK